MQRRATWRRRGVLLSFISVLSPALVLLLDPNTAHAGPCGSDKDCPGDLVCDRGSCVSIEATLTEEQKAERARRAEELRVERARKEEEARIAAAEAAAAAEAERAKKAALLELERQHAEEERKRATAQAEEERARQAAIDAERRRDDERLSDARRPTRLIAYGMFGGAAVGVGLTVIFGVIAITNKKDLDSACVESMCAASMADTKDSMEAAATASTVSLAASALFLGAGIYFLVRAASITLPPASPAPTASSSSAWLTGLRGPDFRVTF